MRLYCLFASAVASASASAPKPTATLSNRDILECLSVANGHQDLMTSIPLAPSNVVTYVAQQTQWSTISDQCEIPAVTGSVATDYSVWVSSLSDWQMDHKTELSSLMSVCSDDNGQFASSLGLANLPALSTFCEELHWASSTASPTSGGQVNNNDTGDAALQKVGILLGAALTASFTIFGLL